MNKADMLAAFTGLSAFCSEELMYDGLKNKSFALDFHEIIGQDRQINCQLQNDVLGIGLEVSARSYMSI